jgi:SAM-dependent methyltransferase
MTDTADAVDIDRALKARHAAMWASGDYPKIAREIVQPLAPNLVDACSIAAGQRVLDVAAGTGNVAILAAATGADVVASDLTPELLGVGKALAAQQGVELGWREADAESLPFDDGEFDTVVSCIGVMFAPHHQASADELVRTVKPGGIIGLINWTPGGFIGQMFTAIKPYAPPPPPGAQPPPLWGDPDHVRTLFGDRVSEVMGGRRALPVDQFASPEDVRDFFKANYGPTIATYKHIGDDPDRVAALDEETAKVAERYLDGSTMPWEYLLVTMRRAA